MASSKDIDDGKIHIGRLTKDMTKEMVLDYFAQYGSVEAVDMSKRHSYGFVTFCEPSVVNTVLDQDHHAINGKSVIVEKALTREQKGSSMADTRCRDDKLRALGREEQYFSSNCAAYEGRNVDTLLRSDPSGSPSYSAQFNTLQTTPNSHLFASSASSENEGHRASSSVVSASTDQQPPIGSCGHQGLNINDSSAYRFESIGGGSNEVPIYATGKFGPIARPKVKTANRNFDGGIGEERSYNNITGTTSNHSDATWRRTTESSQLGGAGSETGNVATLPGGGSSSGGGSASIADQLSRGSPYEQYESWQSFDTNSGGGSQGTFGRQASILDSNRFVQPQTSAENYPQTFVGNYLGAQGSNINIGSAGYGLNDPRNAPGGGSSSGGVSAVVMGQPPIRSNIYEIGRQDCYNTSSNSGGGARWGVQQGTHSGYAAGRIGYGNVAPSGPNAVLMNDTYNMYGIGRQGYFNTSSNSGGYPFARTEAQMRHSGGGGGGGGGSWGVQQGAGSGYSTARGMGYYNMEPSDPNAALMNDSSQAADYGHNNIGGMDHNLIMPSGPPSHNVWTNDSLQATASYEGGNVADHATTRCNNNERL